MPAKPAKYFNDYAGVVPPATAHQFNEQLASFERETSNQIVVAVFQKMQTDSSIEDYANRVFRSWQVGQKDRNNGAVLFVFIADRKMRIEVGYGLEPVLPDAICKRIIAEEMAPRFRSGDFAGGLGAAINAMIAATRGEYKGTGRTVAEQQGDDRPSGSFLGLLVLFLILIAIGRVISSVRRGIVYDGRGYQQSGWGTGSGSWSSSAWGSSGGGGWSSGGSGGFSGGGGSSGGGGASGSW